MSARAPGWDAPRWLRLWAAAMGALIPAALLALVWLLPWEGPAPLAKPLALALGAAPAVWLGLRYARAVRRTARAALLATFGWAALFTWAGVAQAGPALPEPGPLLAALWITAWVGVMIAQAWRL